jgi:HK97 family phage portal protein
MGVLDRWFGRKKAEVPFINRSNNFVLDTPAVSFPNMSNWNNWVDEGYRKNSAVFQCISTLAFGYSEPPPVVMRDDDPDPKHPLQRLLNRPNALMSHSELMLYSMVYRAVGGEMFYHMIRNKAGQVIELWPYHVGQMWPIPSKYGWVEEFAYDNGTAEHKRIPAADVIHLKWPAINLSEPWRGMSPLLAVAHEVNTDTEATRYLHALLKNDATPRTVLNIKTSITDAQFERLRQQFSMRHGGDNRGGVGVVEGDATISRLSMNLQELAFEALRRVPESRIAGAFRVPAILAGLYVGLEKATYSNYREARSQLTEDTFVPLWRSDSVELTQALASEFDSNPDRLRVTYDTGKVAALQENEDAKYTRVVQGYDAALLTKNEARAIIGLPPVKDLKRDDPDGDVFKGESAPGLPEMPPPSIIDVTPQPPQLTDEAEDEKARHILDIKAKQNQRILSIQQRMEAAAQAKIERDIEVAMEAV